MQRSTKITILSIILVVSAIVALIFLARPKANSELNANQQHSQADSPLKYGLPATSQELISKRTLTSKTFKNANGTYTAILAQGPIHYKDRQGNFQDVQLAFNKQTDNNKNSYISDNAPVHTTVSNNTLQTINPKTGKGVAWIIPSQFTVSNNTATYTSDGVTWTYQLTTSGTKLSAKVDKPQGKKVYSFQYQLVGGAKDFTVDAKTGNLIGDGFIVPKVTVIGKDGKNYDVSGWQMTGQNQISFILDDSQIPQAAYPYTIDPTTTFDIAASGDDGDVNTVDNNYYDTGTTITPDRTPTAGDVAIIRWDTSSLFGEIIQSASISLYITAESNPDGKNLVADWYTPSGWPPDGGDWGVTNTAISGTPISSLNLNTYNDFTLSNPATNINKSGYTVFRIGPEEPAGSGIDYFTFYSFDNGSNIPELHVTYTAPTTYYVDATGGSDSNEGISTDSAWKTVNKVENTTLSPGNTVLFKRGETWREELDINQSGTSDSPISFGAYGTGANPILNESDVETGFVLDSGSIYKLTGISTNPVQVFQDNARLIQKTSKAAMVAGSFYWDSGTSTLYVWTTDSANPSTHTIEASARYRGVNFNGQSYINVDSIDTTKAIQTGYEWGLLTGESNINVSNAVASWNGQRGFRIGSSSYGVHVGDNNIITDSTAHDNLHEGFWIGGGTNNGCLRCEVYNGGKDNNAAMGYGSADIGGIIIGGSAVNNFVKNSYIHDVYKGYVLMVEDEDNVNNIKPTGTIISGNTIANNVVNLTTTVMEQGEDSTYTNNVIYTTNDGGGDLIQLNTQGGTATGSVSPVFYNNTLYMGSTDYGDLIDLINASNPTFKNNIIYEPIGSDGNIIEVAATGVTGITSDYNDFYDEPGAGTYNYVWEGNYYDNLTDWKTASGQDTHSIASNPQFINIAGYHFALQSGSPAVDAGTDVGLTIDYKGNMRPYGSSTDIGAYELEGAPSQASPGHINVNGVNMNGIRLN